MAFDKCRQVAVGLWGSMRSNPPGSRCDDSHEPKWHRASLFALPLLLLAAGCGGGGEGTVPPPLTAGLGTLAPGVRVLSDAENSRMVSSSLSEVVVSGSLNVAPGTVVMAKDSVFKVVSGASASGQTVLTVVMPEVGDVFDRLSFSGTFAGATGVALSATRQRVVRQAATVGRHFSFPVAVAAGGFTASGDLTGSLSSTAVYDYDKSKGGLQSAQLTVDLNATTVETLGFSGGGGLSGEVPVGTLLIPIPVSIFDAALGFIGVHPVSVFVPFVVGGSASANMDLSASTSEMFQASVAVSYDKLAGIAMTQTASATQSTSPVLATVPTGAPVLASFGGSATLYLGARPALAFLNTVALAGLDVKLSVTENATAKVVATAPGYCLNLTPASDVTLFGFFKGVGMQPLKTSLVTLPLFEGTPILFPPGGCLAATTVEAVNFTPGIGDLGRPIEVQVTVALDSAMSPVSPTSPPTGSVKVALGDGTCVAILNQPATASASGACSLLAGIAGTPATVTLEYLGDGTYTPSQGVASLEVRKAATTTVMSTSPDPSAEGGVVTFSASTAPPPTLAREPTGEITINDLSGAVVCVAVIQSAGTGTCTASLTGPGTKSFTAFYGGDANFLASQSAPVGHEVSPCAVQCTAPATCQSDGTCKTPCQVSGCTGAGTCQSDGTCKTACQVLGCTAPATCQGDGTCKTPCQVTGCTGAATCQSDGTCKTPCQVSGCTAPATCQGDGTCKTPCQVMGCPAPETCQPDGTCQGPPTKHWAGTFRATTGTPAPPGGWYWEDPRFAMGPDKYSQVGYFYFADGRAEVVLGSSTNGPSTAEFTRRVFPLGWRSTDATFGYSIPTAFATYTPNTPPGVLSAYGSRTVTFVVANKTATQMNGTFEVRTTSGYWLNQFVNAPDWRTVATTASGTWSASLVNAPPPQTKMNGHDFCIATGAAWDQNSIDPIPAGANPVFAPGFVGSPTGTCTYQ
jgi:hypothetical protein